ncbi:hypothetical protein [Paenibacillus sp. FSL R7-0179]|uniref:hypothetical protein n=1 Tax=Paenibacillus sp. FSL R7-0179 TaxID=2921672 RepID=UPI0030F810C5
MPLAELWYHDENEVDERHSWLKNSPYLIANTMRKSYDNCSYSKVLALVEYARPDFVLTVDGEPLLSVEATQMNPSGHNMPQRFSCLLRAAEMGIPSLFYYPEYSRRSTSDPNPRYLNVRTPLAQLRATEIFEVPSLSMFWPTDTTSLMPTNDLTRHSELADFVEYTLKLYLKSGKKLLVGDAVVSKIQNEMMKSCTPVTSYSQNSSFRKIFPHGDSFTKGIVKTTAIDPPTSCIVEDTASLLEAIYSSFGKRFSASKEKKKVKMVLARENTFVYQGTANKQKTGPEHPFPGYLTLLDILYMRYDHGQTSKDRIMNLAFKLPIEVDAYIRNAVNRPTGLNILMEFSDFIILEDAVVLGGWMRNVASGAILVRR